MNAFERYQLCQGIDSYMIGLKWPANAQEPDYVAFLVNNLPNAIQSAFNRICPGRMITTGSAFIHQKPIVHFINKSGYKDPELGDLLIVCREKRSFGTVYNAMILQAKCASDLRVAHIPADHQFFLYSEWPEFEYKRAGFLNGKRRSILPKTITQGAQYLLIKKEPHVRMLTATVDRPLNGSRYFYNTLVSVLSFDDGRTFQSENPRDDWSQMILDLLRLSARSLFTRRNSGFRKANRWNGDECFNYLLNPEVVEKELEIKSNNHERDDNADFIGISVICIDLGEEVER